MESAETLHSMQDLMEEILQIQIDNARNTESVQRIQQIIEKSNKLVEKSELANEILLDAKILHTGSQVVNYNVSSVDTNLTSFNEDDFQKGILSYMRNIVNGAVTEKSWECFAPVTYHLFNKSHPMAFMLGSLSLDPLPVVEKTKSERSKKICQSKQRLCPSEDTKDVKDKEEEDIYDQILKSLVKYYKKNEKQPVLFLDFIIDPESYWHSVENIFYFSFLVRDGRVNVYLNNDGLPVIEPVLRNDTSEITSARHGNQFSFSLSKQDWRDCIKNFGILHAKIKHL